MADDLGERTELPTQRRLQEAREQGQVVKSTDLAAGIDLVGAFILILLFGTPLTLALAGIVSFLLDDRASGTLVRTDGPMLGETIAWASTHTGLLLLPAILIMFVIAFGANVMQVGLLVSGESITPKLDKLDPIKGFGRVFAIKNVIKTLLGLVKMSAVTAVAVTVTMQEWPKVVALTTLEAQLIWPAIAGILTRLLIWLLLILLVVGVLDYAYQRWTHTRDLRMTKQQIKDEQRSMDGDPEIKGRRLRLARQIAMQRVNQTVPKADVIVTNPTHFSVALKYDPKTMAAPKVIAKGADEMAFRIREVAAAHRVPIVERPPLARALYAGVPVGKQVSPEHYEAVAEILAYVYRLENRQAGKDRAA